MGASYLHDTDPWARERELDDAAYTVDHFFVKLLKLPATLQTTRGREEAERRARFMRVFLEELGREIDRPPGELP
jgi:uncharacterized protein